MKSIRTWVIFGTHERIGICHGPSFIRSVGIRSLIILCRRSSLSREVREHYTYISVRSFVAAIRVSIRIDTSTRRPGVLTYCNTSQCRCKSSGSATAKARARVNPCRDEFFSREKEFMNEWPIYLFAELLQYGELNLEEVHLEECGPCVLLARSLLDRKPTVLVCTFVRGISWWNQ